MTPPQTLPRPLWTVVYDSSSTILESISHSNFLILRIRFGSARLLSPPRFGQSECFILHSFRILSLAIKNDSISFKHVFGHHSIIPWPNCFILKPWKASTWFSRRGDSLLPNSACHCRRRRGKAHIWPNLLFFFVQKHACTHSSAHICVHLLLFQGLKRQ